MSVAAEEASSDPPAPPARPVVVGATRPEEARRLLSVAARVAQARGADLLLAYVAESPSEGGEPKRADDRDLLPRDLSARVRILRHGGRLDTVFRTVVYEYDAELLVLEWRDPPPADAGTAEERAQRRSDTRRVRSLFLDPPCEAWLVRGGLGGRALRSMLILPSQEQPEEETLHAARALRGQDTTVTLLDVHSDNRGTAPDRPVERLDDVLGDGHHAVRTVRAKSRERALVDELGERAYDLVVIEAPREGVLPVLAGPALPEDIVGRLEAPVVVVNGPQGRAVAALRRWVGRLYGWTESLEEPQRIRVYSDLRRSARADRDFLTLTVLATGIAGIGLLLDSAAVIIGAMLVAPFMSPLIALGLAVVHGEPRFMRIGAGAVLRGTLVAYPIGVLLGLLVPQAELTSQVLSRTEPSGLDLLVALLSGAAGAYAYARRDLSAALPGVAIAAALVPPLASSGIALGSGEAEAAAAAALLYALNVGAIAAAAAVVFLWFGFRPETQRFGRMRSFARGFALIVVLIAAVFAGVVVLGSRDRASAQLDQSVARAVEEWTADSVQVESLEVVEEAGGLRVRLRLEAASPAEVEDAEALAVHLADALDRAVEVDLVVLPVVSGEATPSPVEDVP